MQKILLFLYILLTLSACSSSGLFSSYDQSMKPVRAAQNQGDFVKAASYISEPNPSNNNYALNLLELGRLNALAFQYKTSQKNYVEAISDVQYQEAQAKIQISSGLQKAASLVSNDNSISYQVPFYEQSMLYSYQALNYLQLQGIESALVEVRRANLVQQRALASNQEALFEAQKNMERNGLDAKTFDSKYPSMQNSIGQVKNGFQNAYTFYLSGLLYEAGGEPNDAYIDYKKALEIYPHNRFLQQDVLRLATSLGMQDDLAKFSQLYGKAPNIDENNGELVILYEQGIVANKQAASMNLPIWTSRGDIRFYSFSLAVYPNRLPTLRPLTLLVNGSSTQSQEIVRLQSLASKQLKDDMPAIVTRQILRLIAKEQVRKKASKEGGDVGNIIATLYNVISERADTRSWSTLPDSIHLLRVSLPAGNQKIDLQLPGRKASIEVTIKPGRITLLNLNGQDKNRNGQLINL
ncbi:MAG: COG3014 family protein [Colwellia sp.]